MHCSNGLCKQWEAKYLIIRFCFLDDQLGHLQILLQIQEVKHALAVAVMIWKDFIPTSSLSEVIIQLIITFALDYKANI